MADSSRVFDFEAAAAKNAETAYIYQAMLDEVDSYITTHYISAADEMMRRQNVSGKLTAYSDCLIGAFGFDRNDESFDDLRMACVDEIIGKTDKKLRG